MTRMKAGKWGDAEFDVAYATNSQDRDMNWYEHEVNRASVAALIPQAAHKILDFGCGPGEFSHELITNGYDVDGCDGSGAMIAMAHKSYPDMKFFVWNGSSEYATESLYDACVSILTLHFVDDLSVFAKNIYSVLKNDGSLVLSVPHSLTTIKKANGEYFKQTSYDTEIGSYGITVTMIHRSIQDYINPFVQNGFTLQEIIEPTIPNDVMRKRKIAKEYAAIPRRLNLRFRKNKT